MNRAYFMTAICLERVCYKQTRDVSTVMLDSSEVMQTLKCEVVHNLLLCFIVLYFIFYSSHCCDLHFDIARY